MADLVITAASVLAGADARIAHGIAGEVVAAGKVGYLAAATSRYMLADNDAVSAEARTADLVVFLNAAAAGQPVAVHKRGKVVIGAALTAGVAYYLSNTPGGICPLADVGTGEYVVLLGLATSATELAFAPQSAGVAN
jgi:hypothetical protein